MKTLLLLILSPKNGGTNFQNRFRDDLYKEGFFLAFLYGVVYALNSASEISNDETFFIFSDFFEKIIKICLWLLACTTLSFIIYKIGSFLKGNSNYKETFALLMYTYFPIFCCGLILGLLKHPYLYSFEFNTIFFRYSIYILSWLISLRALFIGVIEIYSIDFKKAIITILPVLISFFGVLVTLLYLHKFHH